MLFLFVKLYAFAILNEFMVMQIKLHLVLVTVKGLLCDQTNVVPCVGFTTHGTL